ncbi:sensor domain-containing diguanylate cyclase [Paraglaciecola arctica]|uniref:sensor domain-containing diguanylate cyclase n=1 Tax=Paraglaciecola arctica TaxID=1128911 RepID=UPI00209018AB|nr:diguanylate cyclase [Paraglaciecola arctica]
MRIAKLFVLTIIYCVGIFNTTHLSAQPIPSIDVRQDLKNGNASLAGDWALNWGEWTPLAIVNSPESKFKIVQLPNFVSTLVDEKTLNKYRFGTYALKLKNLKSTFKEPVIRMRNVNDAWQAWWIDESGVTQYLGESGKIAKEYDAQQMRFKTYILQLPKNDDSGTLVIYLSAQLYSRAGMYGAFEVTELEQANKSLLSDLASRVALIAIGLLVVFQNILFFIFRPKERVLLLLAMFAFTVLLRATVSTDYAYYLLGDPLLFDVLLRLEYITIVWPAVAGVHFFSCLYPAKYSDLMIKLGYTVVAIVVSFTFLVSLQQVVSYLLYYQVILGIFSLYTLWLIIHSIIDKSHRSTLMFVSGLILFFGVINDVTAALSSSYNLYLAEYTLFLFLFAQTQYHSLRFVSALDTAEHLTDNLQEEVAEKTQELSSRNRELEDKAKYLKIQNDQIKELSETDHLTGLFNRQTFDSYFELQFSEAITQSKNLALVMLDIDNFKKINDTYGHQVGDECLKAVAQYLKQANLRKDDFIARYGGEEIVIILNNTDIKSAQEICQRICDGMSRITLKPELNSVVLTASFGLAEVKFNGANNIDQLLKSADDALYKAKAQGKNQVITAVPA